MLRRVAAFCRPPQPVLLLVPFPRSRSLVVGVPGLCWMWQDVPFARQRRPATPSGIAEAHVTSGIRPRLSISTVFGVVIQTAYVCVMQGWI